MKNCVLYFTVQEEGEKKMCLDWNIFSIWDGR